MSELSISWQQCRESGQVGECGSGKEEDADGAARKEAWGSNDNEVQRGLLTGFASGVLSIPSVKICGLTDVDEAIGCVELGAKAIGCVFYPPSPRHLTDEKARDICRALPPDTYTVGVFVNESFESIMQKVEHCGLRAVQLHGRESADLVEALVREGVAVIKTLFVGSTPSIGDARSFDPSAYLVECAGGKLPGGNAMTWDWGKALDLAEVGPIIIAGGLDPENVPLAIRAAMPDALDVSSGVEAQPGTKDLNKVRQFLHAVSQSGVTRKLRRVFG